MPTTKKRLNISLSPDLEKVLKMSAKRDNMPQATKATELIKFALEIEEDQNIEKFLISSRRLNIPLSEYVSHEEAWKHLK